MDRLKQLGELQAGRDGGLRYRSADRAMWHAGRGPETSGPASCAAALRRCSEDPRLKITRWLRAIERDAVPHDEPTCIDSASSLASISRSRATASLPRERGTLRELTAYRGTPPARLRRRAAAGRHESPRRPERSRRRDGDPLDLSWPWHQDRKPHPAHSRTPARLGPTARPGALPARTPAETTPNRPARRQRRLSPGVCPASPRGTSAPP